MKNTNKRKDVRTMAVSQFKGDFVTENELKQAFDEQYVKRQISAGKLLKHSYEAMRHGGADLVTIEVNQDRFQIRAFEFKLTDWRKALLQAKENLKFAHQSFIVVPVKQVKNINDSGSDFLAKNRNIGIISVDPENNKWKMEKYAISQNDSDITLSQEILSLVVSDEYLKSSAK